MAHSQLGSIVSWSVGKALEAASWIPALSCGDVAVLPWESKDCSTALCYCN